MRAKTLQWIGILLALEIGFVHFFSAQHEFEESALLGYLFILNFLGALVAANGIYHKRSWGWWIGLGIAVPSILCYIWSRTTGLPGLEVEPWFTPWGSVSLVVEIGFILLALLRPWRWITGADQPAPRPTLLRFLPASFILLFLLVGNGLIYQWDAATDEMDMGQGRMVTADELVNVPVTSFADLEARYGVRVTQAAISMMGGIVDVRLKVDDPEKARTLLDSHMAMLADEQALVFAPHMHNHAKMKPGQILVMFFPTERNTIHAGSRVNLVFGDVRVEPVVVE